MIEFIDGKNRKIIEGFLIKIFILEKIIKRVKKWVKTD